MVSTAVLQHAEENASVARMTAALREASMQPLKARFDRAVEKGESPAQTDTDTLARFYGAIDYPEHVRAGLRWRLQCAAEAADRSRTHGLAWEA